RGHRSRHVQCSACRSRWRHPDRATAIVGNEPDRRANRVAHHQSTLRSTYWNGCSKPLRTTGIDDAYLVRRLAAGNSVSFHGTRSTAGDTSRTDVRDKERWDRDKIFAGKGAK